jgi:hypothetical protein
MLTEAEAAIAGGDTGELKSVLYFTLVRGYYGIL